MATNGMVPSVGSLGKDFSASDNRSYWNNPVCYIHFEFKRLLSDWENFLQESRAVGNRRAILRAIVSRKVLEQARGVLPIEAVIPQIEENQITYLAQNEHEQISPAGNFIDSHKPQLHLPSIELRKGFSIHRSVEEEDASRLFELWEQFGWTKQGVINFIHQAEKPIVVVRNPKQEIVGAMIGESLKFGGVTLVEITEMAVLPEFQGNGVAKVLIQNLSALCLQKFGQKALIYGEFNLTTNAHKSALAAGMTPGISQRIDGVLRDHVAIRTGSPKQNIGNWNTGYIHSYQVMYWDWLMSQKLSKLDS